MDLNATTCEVTSAYVNNCSTCSTPVSTDGCSSSELKLLINYMKDLASLFTAAPTSEQRITDLQNISDTAISIFIQLPTVGEGETRSEEKSAPQCV